MIDLTVYIEIDGKLQQTGTIIGNSSDDAVFSYSDSFLQKWKGRAVSLSLPATVHTFSPEQTKNFFSGLLPEGFARKTVAQWMHVDENDYAAIAYGLGRECLGAIRITSGNDPDDSEYEKLSPEQVRALAREGITKSTELVTKAHLSLTGASGKVGLYYDPTDRMWFLPKGNAPSTHIVKQSHIRLNGIVTNEQLCLETAKKLGIQVPESFIIETGGTDDGSVLFATKRYDRILEGTEKKVSGLWVPFRLHQEDFAQALGIPAEKKYESYPNGYVKRMFDLLLKKSASPVEDRWKLWDVLIFDYLIGNTDNHIKNLSLLYSKNLMTIRLAPVYDLLSTVIYESSTRDFSLFIGKENNLDKITRESWKSEAENVGLGKKLAMERFDILCNSFREALTASSEELYEAGYENAVQIKDRILKKGGYSVAEK